MSRQKQNLPAHATDATNSNDLEQLPLLNVTGLDRAPNSLATLGKDDAEYIASALVKNEGGTVAAKVAAFQRMLATPFLSPRAAAKNRVLVTLVDATEGEVESITEPGVMIPQYIFLAALQNDYQEFDAAGNIVVEYFRGDMVLIGQSKNRVRDGWFSLVKEANAAGERLPNVLLLERQNKNPKLSPSIGFYQLSSPESAR